MYEDLNQQYNIIIGWIRKKGYEVYKSGKVATFYPEQKEIHYNLKSTLIHQIYDLLHECGHLICSETTLSTEPRYKTQRVASVDGRTIRSMRYRIEILREEFEAWELAYELSQKLKLKIDYDDMQKYAAKNIASYCDWISKRNWDDNY